MKKNLLPRILAMIVILAIAGIISFQTNAQQTGSPFQAEYSRPSVTFFITSYSGDQQSVKALNSAKKISFSDKYFNHNLAGIEIPMTSGFKGKTHAEKKKILKHYLEDNRIGNKMVAKWFNRQENGMFNLDYVHECGMYDASDQDVLMSTAAKRGEAVLKDAGQNLVNRTYVLIISPKEFTSFDDETSHGWRSQFDAFLFKLDFDDEDVSRFYEIWPYEDDPEDVKDFKIAAFDTLQFNFRYVYGKPGMMSSSMEIYALTSNPKSSNQLFDEMVEDMYTDLMFAIDKDLEAFRVKVNVSGTHPIRAKIGKKEGLKTDQRYFVYEFVWDDYAGEAVEKRKGVVRAKSKIADNRNVATGKSPESQFYQIYGGTIRQGMVLQQRNDFGISLLAGYGFGGISGFEAGLWIRTGFFTRVPALYVIGDIGFDNGDYVPPDLDTTGYNFFRFSVGLAKGIRFGRIFELSPLVAWGQETTKDDTYSTIKTNYVKGGGMLGINITPALYVFGQVNYFAPFGNVLTKKDDGSSSSSSNNEDDELETMDYTWTDQYEDREGVTMMFGIRFEF